MLRLHKKGRGQTSGSVWTGRWIEPKQEPVTEEPEFSLAQMFGGAPLPPQAPTEERLHPTQPLRRTFQIHAGVVKATMRCTARGLYQAFIDGKAVTDAVLLPGFTSYHQDMRYQEFDVTPHPVGDLRFCHTVFENVRGSIRVDWERQDDGRLRVEVEVPLGTHAQAKLTSWEERRLLGPGLHVLFG